MDLGVLKNNYIYKIIDYNVFLNIENVRKLSPKNPFSWLDGSRKWIIRVKFFAVTIHYKLFFP